MQLDIVGYMAIIKHFFINKTKKKNKTKQRNKMSGDCNELELLGFCLTVQIKT
jgi:hypothetical protein